jgi:8-oxo-dGTP pyrophosphatase MutT (NUDIX family)
MEFNNTPNKCIKVDNNEYWISRAVAVVGILIFRNIDTQIDYVLLEKRSEKMDHPNQWCVPCGYLDFNEDGWECLTREVWEETGFYLSDYVKNINFDNDKQPFFVNTNPGENRQNIALRYGVILHFKDNEFPHEITNNTNDEVSDIQFVTLDDVDTFDIAFHHDIIIKNFTKKYLKNNEKKC